MVFVILVAVSGGTAKLLDPIFSCDTAECSEEPAAVMVHQDLLLARNGDCLQFDTVQKHVTYSKMHAQAVFGAEADSRHHQHILFSHFWKGRGNTSTQQEVVIWPRTLRHNYIDHNLIGHTFIGHSYTRYSRRSSSASFRQGLRT